MIKWDINGICKITRGYKEPTFEAMIGRFIHFFLKHQVTFRDTLWITLVRNYETKDTKDMIIIIDIH